MNVIFMGTPDFAVPCLEYLIAEGHQISLAVTQPDKPKGRGRHMQYPPVKEAALAHGIPIFQPKRIRDPESIASLKQYPADVIVVVAFGQILPEEVLQYPKYGCVNVHGSLLPKYRGAAPIQWAVINGDPVSGVTTMQMDAGLDTGDILLKQEVPLAPDETGGSLFDKLSQTGARLCAETLTALAAGTVTPVPQDESLATHTSLIRKSDGAIDFSASARSVECLIRGMNPWPSAYTRCHGKTLKIWKAAVVSGEPEKEVPPGTVTEVRKNSFLVSTGQGRLEVLEVQLEGKKRMDAGAFLRGNHLAVGDILGQ
ncbi:MAG: methionyl-tRNA formyltransferase [Lachnospiraceae bacterium]|jgi:methionyl-tRNA formyltransferase|nr:methionyl-tRNA formyltransferase [Lachnospiraceae bacterium]MCI1658014.1 methionyl-tRNA formyltransferase [Lachnospiraceae bacterium]MCI2196368.1 methionyl-tRNA formyltransferase [Lachnospiraceae bacterium]